MIPLIRKNIRLLGIGKNLLLFIGCFLFSFSSRGGTVLSFEQQRSIYGNGKACR